MPRTPQPSPPAAAASATGATFPNKPLLLLVASALLSAAVVSADVCTPPESTCWDGSVVYANPPDCVFPKCPPCPQDSHTCPDGSVVHRDPQKGCNFKPCAEKQCEGDTFTCPGSGAIVGRDANNFCEFEECPTTCPDEYQICDDGSRVYRNPLNKCQFDLCGGREMCPPDVYECPKGMGYVYRDENNNCEFFPCALATAPTDGSGLANANTNDYARRAAIFNKIKESGASAAPGLFVLSPQSLALDWLASHDPARLDTDHPALMQRYALAVFYFSTFTYDQLGQVHLGSDMDLSHGWGDESGWLTGLGICSWFGVQCYPRVSYSGEGKPTYHTTYDDNDGVTHLNLTNNNVRGVLPREFSVLEDLRVLDLSENVIAGPIPTRWAGMSNITVLALQLNRLIGPIPLQLFNFHKLQVLNLEYNWLDGPIPDFWHMLPNLRQLRLGLNEFNETIPVQLGSLSELRVLWLDANKLEGRIPSSFYYLHNLQSLFLHRNKLNGPIPGDIRGMTSLKELTLAENELAGPIPREMGSMTSLFSLYLENNKLVGPIPTELAQLENLVVLRIFNNDISTPMPPEICKLRNSPTSQLVWLSADCAVPHDLAGGEDLIEVRCQCCDECHGGFGDAE